MITHRAIPITILSALLLSACAGAAPQDSQTRVELPQQFRLEQDDLARMFERRSGRIAVVGDDGNLTIMDQTGGGVTKITRDGNLPTRAAQRTRQLQRASSQSLRTLYALPAWSPDASHVAFVEFKTEPPTASTTVDLNPQSVTVERGDQTLTYERTDSGSRQLRDADKRFVQSNPTRVIVEKNSQGDFVSSALYTSRSDGKGPLNELFQSRSAGVTYLDWSPDGQSVAFLAENVRDDNNALSVAGREGNDKPKQLIETNSAGWDWSADGRTLATTVNPTGRATDAQLMLLDTQSGESAKAGGDAAPAYKAPNYSSDGRYMLVTRGSGSNKVLALADQNGNEIKELVNFSGRIAFAWSPVPGDPRVAYITRSTDQQRGGPLRIVNVDTGEVSVLSQLPVVAFFWSPDGVRLALFSPARVSDITPDFPGVDLTPDQPTNPYLLHMQDTTTRVDRQLYYFEPTPQFERLLTDFDQFSRSRSIWSPDSRRIVFALTYSNGQASQNVIVESEASGSIEPRFLGNGSIAIWSPR